MKYILVSSFFLLIFQYHSFCKSSSDFCLKGQGESENVFIDSVKISFKEYTFKVISTYLNDSVFYDEPNMFYPICKKQVLLFYKNGILISTQNYPVNMIYQLNYSKERILMQENVISEIGVINNGDHFLFTLSGYGGCNSCAMYDALYSSNGTILWCFYGNEEDNGFVRYKKGNRFKILNKYKINTEKYLKGDYKKVSSYPFKQ